MSKEFDELVLTHGLEALQKYFPFSAPIDFDDVVAVEEKADGSLISTYTGSHNAMRLKSKTSLTSIMACDAESFLQLPENIKLEESMRYFHDAGYTVVGEWCDSTKPESRIVLAYDKPQLRIFGVRRISDGKVIDYRSSEGLVGDADLEYQKEMQDILVQYSVDVTKTFGETFNMELFNENVPDETGIEGYIYVFKNGLRLKRKTSWYITQHRLKDTVKNVNALFMAVVAEASDDLKSIFHDNPDAVRLIVAMEEYVLPIIGDLVSSVENFYEDNKNLDRKDYAVKGQKELERYKFSAAMNLYLDKPNDYKMILEKNVKLFTADFNYDVMDDVDE